MRYANGSMSWCLHVPVKEYSTAAVRPPRSLPKNVQFRRLCGPPHKRRYVEFPIMRSWISPHLFLCCRVNALLRIIHRARPGTEASPSMP